MRECKKQAEACGCPQSPSGASTPLQGPWTFPLQTPVKCPLLFEGFPFLRYFRVFFPNLSQFICLGSKFIADNATSLSSSREGATDSTSICWAAPVCQALLSPRSLARAWHRTGAGESDRPRLSSCPWHLAAGSVAAGKSVNLEKLQCLCLWMRMKTVPTSVRYYPCHTSPERSFTESLVSRFCYVFLRNHDTFMNSLWSHLSYRENFCLFSESSWTLARVEREGRGVVCSPL